MDAAREQEHEERIRRKAHEIWEREGRPEGRAAEHWDKASELLAQEEGLAGTLRRNPSHGPDDVARRDQPVEPILAVESLGDLPGLADQGEERQVPAPDRRTAREEG
ncbi:DUF2934 domain-containing protein [Rhodocista pekingensis]|uniref:DUF2934 domain-containing protein n=1 Tax=Rhodocista pekingensis TaxID=201185 RepID=A0ABW2KU77_9PROT